MQALISQRPYGGVNDVEDETCYQHFIKTYQTVYQKPVNNNTF